MPTATGNIQCRPAPALFEAGGVDPTQKDFEDGNYFQFEDGLNYDFEN